MDAANVRQELFVHHVRLCFIFRLMYVWLVVKLCLDVLFVLTRLPVFLVIRGII